MLNKCQGDLKFNRIECREAERHSFLFKTKFAMDFLALEEVMMFNIKLGLGLDDDFLFRVKFAKESNLQRIRI